MANEEMMNMAPSENLGGATTSFDGPIAGQSLTNNPEAPLPFEQAPEFVALHPALEHVWESLIRPEIYVQAMKLLNNGVPVMDLTRGILFMGFNAGKWNPDLMTMLLEPTAYMLIALAEKQDIPFVVYHEEAEDEIENEEKVGIEFTQEQIQDMKNVAETSKVPEGVLTAKMQEDLEKLSEIKIEESVEETTPEPKDNQESLMARPEQ